MKICNIVFRTNPVIIHYNGYAKANISEHHYFDTMQRRFFSEPSRNIGSVKDLTIVTWNSFQNKSLVERSLEHLGVPHLVLGKDAANKPWNHFYKIETLLGAIGSISTKYILGLDAFDVMVLDDPAKVVERFERSFKCDLLYNASVYEWPKDYHTRQFEENASRTAFRYLNGGIFIGNTEYIKYVLDMAVKLRKEMQVELTEQPLLRILYRLLYPRVQIDSRCAIFQTLKGVKCFSFNDIFFLWPYYKDDRRASKKYIPVPQGFEPERRM